MPRIIQHVRGHHVAGVWGEAPGLQVFASWSRPCVQYLEGSTPKRGDSPQMHRIYGRQRGIALMEGCLVRDPRRSIDLRRGALGLPGSHTD